VPTYSKAEARKLREQTTREGCDWSMVILGHFGLLTGFDTETGEVPCDHEVLIREFADGSRGLFQPEALMQQNGKTDDSDCEVQFVFRDRLYRYCARNFGDYYDVEHTVSAMNRAMEDAGLAEQFVEMDTGDQTASFVFGELARVERAAKEFRWPLMKDAPEEE
jgi:hypothetical protein